MPSTSDTVLIRKSTLETSKPPTNYRYLLWIFLVIVIIGGIAWYLVQPELVKISISSVHIEGETVEYLVEWNEEQRPKHIEFAVRNSPVKESWDVTPLMRKKQGSFSTIGWDATQYTYLVTVTERNGKSSVKTGSFQLQKRDLVQPKVEVTRIKPHYLENEPIQYEIRSNDDRALKTVSFEIQNTELRQKWVVNAPELSQKGTLTTDSWAVNHEYTYVVTAEDQAGNRFEKNGSFYLEGFDKTAPVGKISGILKDYHLGDTVSFFIEATDDKGLQDIEFTIEMGLIKQIWHTNSRASQQQSSFSTTGWQAGTYEYTLKVTDSTGNISMGKSSFILGEIDKIPPALTYKGIEKSYNVGDTIAYSLEVTDNKELDKISLLVSSSPVQETWTASGTDYKLHSSFSTAGWQPGNYTYTFVVTDKSNNSTGEVIGTFTLNQPTAPHLDIASLLNQCREHFAADRLMLGKSGSAFECYQQVLELEPQQTEALAGIQSIADRYRQLIEKSLQDKELDKTATFITRLEQVNPKSQGLNELRLKLKQAQSAASATIQPVQTQPVVKSAVKQETKQESKQETKQEDKDNTPRRSERPKSAPQKQAEPEPKDDPPRPVERPKSPPQRRATPEPDEEAPPPRRPVERPKPLPPPQKPSEKLLESAGTGCKTCTCSDVLTKLSIGVEPLTQEEKSFLRAQCR